ncbi:MAG: hypothetical protein IMF05_13675 [Proteobacteria bacterium]|nr:hypothetical protein [Pseudomonadota bacterium]
MVMKKQTSPGRCRKFGVPTKIITAAGLLLAGTTLCVPASASESGTEMSFLESASLVETLDDAALQQLRAGVNEAPAPTFETDGTVAIKLWDGWRQRRPNDSGEIGGSSATAAATVTINGAIQ